MSMAMKYAMKKRMAKGGEAGVHKPHKSSVGGGKGESLAGDHARWAQAEQYSGNPSQAGARNMMAKREHHKVLSELHGMRGQDRTNLAEGGWSDQEEKEHRSYGGVHAPAGGKGSGRSDMGVDVQHGSNMTAKMSAKRHLHTLISQRRRDRTNLAHGGEVHDPYGDDQPTKSGQVSGGYASGGDCMACKGGVCMEHGGMVDRIMAKRMPDFAPNEFDELELEPAPSPPHSGGDYGDDLGDEAVDEDEHDLVARIMRSRAKKDRMPRTA